MAVRGRFSELQYPKRPVLNSELRWREGNESVFLADWTSIHLDIIAQDRRAETIGRLALSIFKY